MIEFNHSMERWCSTMRFAPLLPVLLLLCAGGAEGYGGAPLRPVLTSHACVVRTQIVIMNAHRLSKMQVREAKRRFREAAVMNHPDHGGDPEAFKEAAAKYDDIRRNALKPLSREEIATEQGGIILGCLSALLVFTAHDPMLASLALLVSVAVTDTTSLKEGEVEPTFLPKLNRPAQTFRRIQTKWVAAFR